MRQFVGSVPDATTVRDLLLSVAPPGSGAAAGRLDARRAGHDGARRRADARCATRSALADWGDVGGYEPRCCGTPATSPRSGMPLDRASGARSRPCPAASRSGSCSRPCCAARTRCCCSTSPTTTSTCPASVARGAAARRRAKTVLLSATTGSCSPRAAAADRHRRGRADVWVHGGGFATYHEARRGPERAARRAAPALGRGAREAEAQLVLMLQAARPRQRRNGVALPGRGRPGCASSRRRARPSAPTRAERQDAAARRPHRQARGDLRAARAHRADAAVRPRRSGTASGSRCSARTARASRTSCGCSPASKVATTPAHGEARRAGRARARSPRPTTAPDLAGRTLAGACSG